MKNSPETLRKRNELKREWKKNTPIGSFPKEIKRVCKDCKKLKLCKWQSSFSQTGKPEYYARCNECHLAYKRKVTKTPHGRIVRRRVHRKHRTKKKLWAVNKLGGKCKVCGYDRSLAALTFHHRDSSNKKYSICGILDWSLEKLSMELEKCDLMCFNCHMELHADEDERSALV